MIDRFVTYVQAGLDESLANFCKGVFASAVVAAAGYALKHATHFSPTVQEISLYFVLGVPALTHFWNWVTTTAADATPETTPAVAG